MLVFCNVIESRVHTRFFTFFLCKETDFEVPFTYIFMGFGVEPKKLCKERENAFFFSFFFR